MGNKIKAAADIRLLSETKEEKEALKASKKASAKSSKKGKKPDQSGVEAVEEEIDPEEAKKTYNVYFKWTGPEQPSSVEYKKGRFGKYSSVPMKDNISESVQLTRGTYQARYKVEGVGYLCPNQISPTLLRQIIDLLQKQADKYLGGFDVNTIIGDGESDPQLEQLPDGKMKDLLIRLQNLMPCNEFIIKPKFQKKSGKWPQGKRYLNMDQQTRRFIRKKAEDPVVRATAKIAARKAAIEAIRYGLSQAGLTFDDVFQQIEEVMGLDFANMPFDLDTKLDNLDEPFGEEDMAEIQKEHDEAAAKGAEENLPATLRAAASKRPRVGQGNKIPVRFFWADIAGGTDISCVYWKAEKPDKKYTVKLNKKPDPPEEQKKGFISGYEATEEITPGKYRYRWMVDGVGFYKPTRQTDGHDHSGKSFRIRLIHPPT